MQYKDILLYIDDGVSNTERVNTALGLAKAHGATITGVALASVKPAHLNVKDPAFVKILSEQSAQEQLELFIEAAKIAGVAAISRVIVGNQSSASRKMAQFARNFDLVMLRQANPTNPNASIVNEVAEQVILLGGRPVFFMPYIGAHRIPCKKAMIAWDGTPAVTRAVHDALPLLVGLDEVMILIIEGKTKTARGELLADNLSAHLKNHGVNAVVNRRTLGSIDVPTIVLNEISDNDMDLLVMGGYGTPSLQQKIFGGVTRTLLSSMTVPVFMSH